MSAKMFYTAKARAAHHMAEAHNFESLAAVDDATMTMAAQEAAFVKSIKQRGEWLQRERDYIALAANA